LPQGNPRRQHPARHRRADREQTRGLLDRGHRLPVQGFDVLMLGSLVRQAAEW
jgi:hypothetical protein